MIKILVVAAALTSVLAGYAIAQQAPPAGPAHQPSHHPLRHLPPHHPLRHHRLPPHHPLHHRLPPNHPLRSETR